MKVKYFITLLACLTFMACLSANVFRKLTVAEEGYLSDAMSHPLIFVVPAEDSDRCWGAIQSFIGKYSSMKIENITDYIIETHNPYSTRFGYRAVRTDLQDGVEFSVSCTYDNMFSKNAATQNSHILAYYLTTGEIIPRLINK